MLVKAFCFLLAQISRVPVGLELVMEFYGAVLGLVMKLRLTVQHVCDVFWQPCSVLAGIRDSTQ